MALPFLLPKSSQACMYFDKYAFFQTKINDDHLYGGLRIIMGRRHPGMILQKSETQMIGLYEFCLKRLSQRKKTNKR